LCGCTALRAQTRSSTTAQITTATLSQRSAELEGPPGRQRPLSGRWRFSRCPAAQGSASGRMARPSTLRGAEQFGRGHQGKARRRAGLEEGGPAEELVFVHAPLEPAVRGATVPANQRQVEMPGVTHELDCPARDAAEPAGEELSVAGVGR